MLNIIWDTKGYFFWLLIVSLFCWILERIWPWRKQQKAFRKQIWQDLFWLIFNGHYAGILLAFAGVFILKQAYSYLHWFNLPSPESFNLLSGSSLWLQFIVFLLLKDFIEWLIHRLLHRVPLFWEFHKLHHSIEELDWIGNFRFHWMEIIIYKSITYFPLVILGVDGNVILWIAVIGTLIGHLNHSNLKINWGIFRYVLNSSRFHVWHHDVIPEGKYGKNFAIIFSLWDWLFGTAYYPSEEQPKKLGFDNMDKYPENLWMRFVYPFWKKRT
ncbi:MAG: sterol desaturase family protein [Bacteroidetes bacterium]|nr:sterol desaturase family protein [Bacteroidota bacterium]